MTEESMRRIAQEVGIYDPRAFVYDLLEHQPADWYDGDEFLAACMKELKRGAKAEAGALETLVERVETLEEELKILKRRLGNL